jgi:hypothetical protein
MHLATYQLKNGVPMKNRVSNFLVVLSLLITIPIIGIIISSTIDKKYEETFITAVAKAANTTSQDVVSF